MIFLLNTNWYTLQFEGELSPNIPAFLSTGKDNKSKVRDIALEGRIAYTSGTM